MPRESRDQFKSRLEEAGLWGVCTEFEDAICKHGFSRKAAEGVSLLLFSAASVDDVGSRALREIQILARDPNKGLPNGMELVPEEVWTDKRPVGLVDEIEWVRQHLAVVDVRAPDCPSAAAWTMLWDARSSRDGYNTFMEKYATKLMPSKRELDAKLAQQDTHTKVEWIEHAIWAACNAAAEKKQRMEQLNSQKLHRYQKAQEKSRETRHLNELRRIEEKRLAQNAGNDPAENQE